MGSTKMALPYFTLTLILAISIPRFHLTSASGFTIDLIHRDSLQSPSLHSSSTQVKSALQRSFDRAKTLVPASTPQSPSTEIVPDRGEYLMRFSLGTPPVETLAIADTGSDLTWIQCQPCTLCFKQKAPLFEPKTSSSYKPVSCSSETCSALSSSACTASKCSYTMSYGDRSYSRGELATETVTLGSTTSGNVSIPRVIIGCGHNDQGTFGGGASGIVGLGGGQVSFIRQIGSSIQGKFSYCLVPAFSSENPSPSKMSFGGEAVVSGAGVVATPIVAKEPDTFYYLTLEGMSVGTQRFDLLSYSSSGFAASENEGNIIIDSGTTLTFLPTDLYDQVEAEVKKQVSLKEISDPQGQLNLCYLVEEESAGVPEITAHFRGADLKLKAFNTFVRTSQSSLCFAFAPATSIAIYGNLAQMDFLVGYDLEKKTVSFKPTQCGKA